MQESPKSFKEEFLEIKKDFKKEFGEIKKEYLEVFQKSKNDWLRVKMLIMAFLRITPKKGSSPYAEALFNNYAYEFEESLIDRLHYQSPKVICKLLKDANAPDEINSAIDLGCGTGLMGEVLKSEFKIKKLTGIDIASNMLEKAKSKNVYDELIENDIVKFGSVASKQNDLITMTDVLVYIGDLTELFDNISCALIDDGFFGFDFELLEKELCHNDFYLRKSARYAYNKDYVEKTLKSHNLLPVIYEEETIRYEYGKPVIGGYFIAKKQNKVN